jgi:tetratricopeptide (TPR) repeat protein
MSQNKNPDLGFCPECNSLSTGSIVQRSTREDRLIPWSRVTKSFICKSCRTEVPAHIWKNLTAPKEELLRDWKLYFQHRQDLLTYARKSKNSSLLKEVIGICKEELASPSTESDHQKYYHILSLCLIAQGQKNKARECSLKGLACSLDTATPKHVVNYIALCLDTLDGEAAVFALKQFEVVLRGQNLDFLKGKIKKAIQNAVLNKDDIEKFNFLKQKDPTAYEKLIQSCPDDKILLTNEVSKYRSNINYVDEFGNPVDPSEIELDSAEFTDEDGNPVDKEGNPIANPNEDHFLKEAVEFLGKEDFQGLFTHVCECLNVTEDEDLKLELNKLRAVALGGLKRHQEARVLLLELLEAAPNDGFVLANYLTSCLASGDPQSASGGITIFYPDLDGASKGAVLESVAEALHVGDLALESLPEEILPDLNAFLKTAKA